MSNLLVSLLCVLIMPRLGASANKAPAWLDTTAPVVTVEPKARYHADVFLVTLSANEPSRIWVAGPSKGAYELYKKPVTVSEDGRTVLRYYAEDDFGNKSRVDSVAYVLDSRPPRITVKPPPGRYRSRVALSFSANEPCRFQFERFPGDTAPKPIQSPLEIERSFEGFITAIDSSGNRSTTDKLSYAVDSVKVRLTISPTAGVYNKRRDLVLTANPPATIFYTFDPLAPPEWFVEYKKPEPLPYGLTVVRCFGLDQNKWRTEIEKSTFVIDTIPPKVRIHQSQGSQCDTITLSTREPAAIRYTTGRQLPTDESPVYRKPVLIPRQGMGRLHAIATDSAGNRSELAEWSCKYDSIPPVITLSRPGGLYSQVLTLEIGANEPSTIFYTLDGGAPTERSLLYQAPLQISRQGATVVRCIAVDDGGNRGKEVQATYTIDTQPPTVKARIDGSIDRNLFTVTFTASEHATIYYEVGGRKPSRSSAVYNQRGIPLRLGQTLSYVAVDDAGNSSEPVQMDDLVKPMVSAVPAGGIYNKRIKITFVTSLSSQVFWRMLPDTAFAIYADSILLDKSGNYTLEYYSETSAGLRSPTRREEYSMDLIAPRVTVSVRKGMGDTAIVLFEVTENATIYYTLDGTNPYFSRTTMVAGNKFTRSGDRISVKRSRDVKLAYYAEDVAGNQSPVTLLDVFRPRAVPNVPAGRDRVYDRILSLTFSTYDQSVTYFARHGKAPTADSAVFRDPITLVKSDTICAFVIDASGFIGDVDTFVYLIDLPPSAEFSTSPSAESTMVHGPVAFDASRTFDPETPLSRLRFRWDFEGDSIWDTDYLASPTASFTYKKPGLYRAKLEVVDEMKRVGTRRRELRVLDDCPVGMVFVVDRAGKTFCIDLYEWPNVKGEQPLTQVSWVEARMHCIDAGKRLCTAQEWTSACRGSSSTEYPYAATYEKGRCPVEGEKPYPSGAFGACAEGYGLRDMVGNVWEWVNDKDGDYPLLMGGAFRSGRSAHCGLASMGTVAIKTADTGFRCCR